MTQLSETEFEAFYAQHQTPLIRAIKRVVGSQQVAEDIAQEAFNTLRQSDKKLSDPANFLYRVAYNKANDELRRKVTRRSKAYLLHPASQNETPYVVDLLKQVTVKQRTALYLKYFTDATTLEVAKTMGIPAGTAKSLIHRAIINLRDQDQMAASAS